MENFRSIFLTGERHTGKTTLILKKIDPFMEYACGFMVQRLMEGDVCRAFCVRSIAPGIGPDASFDKNISGMFITKSKEGWRLDTDVFEEASLKCLQGFEGKKLVILDEIGGIELLSERFMDYLRKVLESGIPCIGVIKSNDSVTAMEKAIHLDNQIEKRRNQLIKDIKKKYKGRILTLTNTERPDVERSIDNFLGILF